MNGSREDTVGFPNRDAKLLGDGLEGETLAAKVEGTLYIDTDARASETNAATTGGTKARDRSFPD